MATPLTLEAVRAAPKVVLHDHLDGGLRPRTIIELADAVGYEDLPSTDVHELAEWFTRGADTRDILQYLATFEHTLAVMQTESALHRVAREAALDLAADGVVYAEVRFAPELHQERGLSLDEVVDAVQRGFRDGEHQAAAAGHTVTVRTIICAMRTASRSQRDRGALRAASQRRRDDRGVRPRRRRDRLPAERPSRRDRDRSPRSRPPHACTRANLPVSSSSPTRSIAEPSGSGTACASSRA